MFACLADVQSDGITPNFKYEDYGSEQPVVALGIHGQPPTVKAIETLANDRRGDYEAQNNSYMDDFISRLDFSLTAK